MPVIAAIDRSDRAERVIKAARTLAVNYEVALHVVHVGKLTVGHVLQGTDRTDPGSEAGRQAAAEFAAEVAGSVEDVDGFEAVGLVGDPATQIIEYAQDQEAEFIVVSGRRRTRLDQALFGGVTQQLVLNADRPVVSVP